jgi:putative restriction endonuclease
MLMNPLTWTRLEKSAYDNGFDVEGPRISNWRTFTSSQTSLRIWLSPAGDAQLISAFSRHDVYEALQDLGAPWRHSLPPGAMAARSAPDFGTLHTLLRRAFQLSRALPDEPLQLFRQRIATMPTTTEAERLVIQRVGQDLFRNGLLDYWEGRCALTGLAVPELLRASHIKPWADCDSDAERLDVHNGLLLAPHLDAAFDRGFITVGDDGHVSVADSLDTEARRVLGLAPPLLTARLTKAHCRYLDWHRQRVFRSGLQGHR